MQDKDLAKILVIEEQEIEQQTGSINGQPIMQKIRVSSLFCPTCKKVLMQQQIAKVDFIRLLNENEEFGLNYCPNCGQKLGNPSIIDCEDVNE